MAEPNDRDREVNNKLARDALMRVGSSLVTIAAYREECEAAARAKALDEAEAAVMADYSTRQAIAAAFDRLRGEEDALG